MWSLKKAQPHKQSRLWSSTHVRGDQKRETSATGAPASRPTARRTSSGSLGLPNRQLLQHIQQHTRTPTTASCQQQQQQQQQRVLTWNLIEPPFVPFALCTKCCFRWRASGGRRRRRCSPCG